jgi:hypothetical protein
MEIDNKIKDNLINNKKLYVSVNNTVKDLINKISDFIIEYAKINNISDVLAIFNTAFFSNVNEQGQIGIQNFKKLEDFYYLINNCNVREGMTMCMNYFKSREYLTCGLMMKLLIDRKLNKSKLPMINYDHVDKRIKEIENILGFDIEELNNNDQNGKKYYLDNTGLPSLCKLWIPVQFIYLNYALVNSQVTWKTNLQKKLKPFISHEDADEMPHYRHKKSSTKVSKNKIICDNFPQKLINPPLSNKEKKFFKITNEDDMLPWSSGFCNSRRNLKSITTNIRNKYNITSIGNISGHTLLILDLCLFFINDKEVINKMILACIMWMVPYDHSINEIFTAAKIMGLFDEYDYKKPIGPQVGSLH